MCFVGVNKFFNCVTSNCLCKSLINVEKIGGNKKIGADIEKEKQQNLCHSYLGLRPNVNKVPITWGWILGFVSSSWLH